MNSKKLRTIAILVIEAIIILLVNLLEKDPLLGYKIVAFSCIFFSILMLPKIDTLSVLIVAALMLAVIFENSYTIPYKEYIFVAPLLGYATRILLSKDN